MIGLFPVLAGSIFPIDSSNCNLKLILAGGDGEAQIGGRIRIVFLVHNAESAWFEIWNILGLNELDYYALV